LRVSATAQSTFATIADSLLGEPDITEGTGFGSNAGLRVRGKIFAMLADDGMVVKLPAERCVALVAEGHSRPFTAGKGRPMREWVVVAPDAGDWSALAREALAFVGG
jgi:YjbR